MDAPDVFKQLRHAVSREGHDATMGKGRQGLARTAAMV